MARVERVVVKSERVLREEREREERLILQVIADEQARRVARANGLSGITEECW